MTSRFVAFLDVLGFGDMVENLDHERLHRIYVNLLVSNAAHSAAQGKFKVIDTVEGQRAIADFSETRLRALVVSDSVMLHSPDDSMKSFIDICAAVGKLLVSGFYSGLPMRGGIAHGPVSDFAGGSPSGEFAVHGLLGLPLVRAYQAEKDFAWAGCVVDDACVRRYEQEVLQLTPTTPDIATLDHLVSAGLLLLYPAPMKSGDSPLRWVINWPRQNRGGVTDDAVLSAFSKHGKSIALDAVQRIVDNTMAFVARSRSHAAGS